MFDETQETEVPEADETPGITPAIDVPELNEKVILKTRLEMIDREYRTPRTLADAARGDAWAINRLEQAEELSAPIRAELAGM
jgi:hypothetical protein